MIFPPFRSRIIACQSIKLTYKSDVPPKDGGTSDLTVRPLKRRGGLKDQDQDQGKGNAAFFHMNMKSYDECRLRHSIISFISSESPNEISLLL